MVSPYWKKAMPLIAISGGAVLAVGILLSKVFGSTGNRWQFSRPSSLSIPAGSSPAQVQRLTDQYVSQTQLLQGSSLGTSSGGALVAREHTDELDPLGLRVSSLWGYWATVVGVKANSVVLHRLPLLANIVWLENVTNSTWSYPTTDPGIDPELMRQRADLPTRALYALGEWAFGEGQHIGYADFLDSIRPGQTINIYYVHYDEVGAQDAVRSISALIPASVVQTTTGYTGIIVKPDEAVQTPYGGAVVLADIVGYSRTGVYLNPGDVVIQIGGQPIFSQADITRVEEELGAGAPLVILRQVASSSAQSQTPEYRAFFRTLQSPPTLQGQYPYIPIRVVEAPEVGGIRVIVRTQRPGSPPLLPNGSVIYAAQKLNGQPHPISNLSDFAQFLSTVSPGDVVQLSSRSPNEPRGEPDLPVVTVMVQGRNTPMVLERTPFQRIGLGLRLSPTRPGDWIIAPARNVPEPLKYQGSRRGYVVQNIFYLVSTTLRHLDVITAFSDDERESWERLNPYIEPTAPDPLNRVRNAAQRLGVGARIWFKTERRIPGTQTWEVLDRGVRITSIPEDRLYTVAVVPEQNQLLV